MAVKTFTQAEKLTAADTNTYLANGGLVYITTLTVSGQSSGSVNSCFTSAFDSYRLVVSFGASNANNSLFLRMRASGTDESAIVYRYAYRGLNAAGGSEDSSNNGATSIYIGNVPTTAGRSFATLDIFNPQKATYTITNTNCNFYDAGGSLWRGGAASVATATQYDGFTILVGGANTFSCDARLYGYRQA
jgi:hypothetical protein